MRLWAMALLFFGVPLFLYAATGTIDSSYKYAWGNKMGWVNFAPSNATVTVTDSAVTGYIWSSVFGWINLAPTNGGVTHNGTGALSGKAWGQNTGWINFNGVTINTATGKFLGTATSEAAGTITFNCANCDVRTTWRPSSSGSSSGSGSGGSGSGGSGSGDTSVTGIVLSGRAYPLSKVTVLKDGKVALTTAAGPDAKFEASLTGLSSGTYSIGVYSEDANGRRSGTFTIPVAFTAGAGAKVSGIFLAPTVGVDKVEVKYGENIAIFGQSAPAATVTISVHSPEEIFVDTVTDEDGAYLYNLDTTKLSYGQHLAKSKATYKNEITAFGGTAAFKVGDKTVLAQQKVCGRGDVNGDCRINLVDFSVAAYWYKRPNPPATPDLNNDGKVDLVDLSIMAYNWTG